MTRQALPHDEVRWTPKNLAPTLVLDGKSLTFFVYGKYASLSPTCGGNLELFSHYTRHFLHVLSICAERVVILDDGVLDQEGGVAKLETVKRRALESTSKLFQTHGMEEVLPPFGCQVFFSVARALSNVDVITCDGEADSVVASMANRHQGIAVSSDGDFYMYALDVGFINVRDFLVSAVGEPPSVTAKVFRSASLTEALGVEFRHLPFIASLIGNDYVARKSLAPFYHGLGINMAVPFRDHGYDDRFPDLIKALSRYVWSNAPETVTEQSLADFFSAICRKARLERGVPAGAAPEALVRSHEHVMAQLRFAFESFCEADPEKGYKRCQFGASLARTSVAEYAGAPVPYFSPDGLLPDEVIELRRNGRMGNAFSSAVYRVEHPITSLDGPLGRSEAVFNVIASLSGDVDYMVHCRNPNFKRHNFMIDLHKQELYEAVTTTKDICTPRRKRLLPSFVDIITNKNFPRENLRENFFRVVGMPMDWPEWFIKKYEAADPDVAKRLFPLCALLFLVDECFEQNLPVTDEEIFVLAACICHRRTSIGNLRAALPVMAPDSRWKWQTLCDIRRWTTVLRELSTLHKLFLEPLGCMEAVFALFDGPIVCSVLDQCRTKPMPFATLRLLMQIHNDDMFNDVIALLACIPLPRGRRPIAVARAQQVPMEPGIPVPPAPDLMFPKQLRCRDCNSMFEYSPFDQKKHADNGWNPPVRCRKCRPPRDPREHK